MLEVKLPNIGEGVNSVVVTSITNATNIKKDETIVTVSADKVDIEIPSPASGHIINFNIKVGDSIKPDELICTIEDNINEEKEQDKINNDNLSIDTDHKQLKDVYATPVTRKLARELGLNLNTISESLNKREITKQDILHYSQQNNINNKKPVVINNINEVKNISGDKITMSNARKFIADKMSLSLSQSAQLTSVIEVDISRLLHLKKMRAQEYKNNNIKLTLLPFFVYSVSQALHKFPIINSLVTDKYQYQMVSNHNIGIAVDVNNLLQVPVMGNIEQLNFNAIVIKLSQIIKATLNNEHVDQNSGTFTITNTGSVGSLFDTPIINPPQVAILGIGKGIKRPVVIEQKGEDIIAIRTILFLSLTYDHRLIDGALAIKFLNSVKDDINTNQYI